MLENAIQRKKRTKMLEPMGINAEDIAKKLLGDVEAKHSALIKRKSGIYQSTLNDGGYH